MSKKLGLIVTLCILIALGVMSACSTAAPTTSTPAATTQQPSPSTSAPPTSSAAPTTTTTAVKIIKFADVGEFTGTLAQYGQDQPIGVDLAVDAVNKSDAFIKAGYQLQAMHYDNASNPDQSALMHRKAIVNDGALFVVGPTVSTNVLSTVATNAELKRPWLVANTIEKITEMGNPYVFRIIASFKSSLPKAEKWVIKNIASPGDKFATLFTNEEWGQSADAITAQTFKDMGMESQLVLRIPFEPTTVDMTPQILKMKQAGVNFVFLEQRTVPGMALIAKQARELGFNAKWDTDGGMMVQLYDVGKEDVVGWTGYVYTREDNPAPDYQAFLTAAKAKVGGRIPYSTTAAIYDGVTLMADLILKVGPDPEKLRDALEHVQGWKGLGGTVYNFSPQNHTGVSSVYIVKIGPDGKYQYLGQS